MASVQIISPTPSQRVRGRCSVRVKVTGGTTVSEVLVIIGDAATGTRRATSVGHGEYVYEWNTRQRLRDAHRAAPADAMFWITAQATVDGEVVRTGLTPVFSANSGRPATSQLSRTPVTTSLPGWRPELAWAADYSGTWADWKRSNFATIGARYAALMNDPVLGPRRRAIRVSVPERARYDADQATPTTVRFQSSSRRNIVEGDEFCVGFAFLPTADFPTVYPWGDPTNPRGNRGTQYIALFQFYGPPYEQGSPFVLQANRSAVTDPLDEFVIRGNELNPGDPGDFLSIPYRRGHWTDVVFRIHASSSIEKGWVETYVNQGESTSVRPLTFANGLHRVPRVLLRSNSQEFRTDIQLYRVIDRFARVTMWHTGHKIARTVREADPRSYRDGAMTWRDGALKEV